MSQKEKQKVKRVENASALNLREAINNSQAVIRLKEIEMEKRRQVLTDEELKAANELQAKAQSRGMKLVPERKVKNRAKFAQIIQDNWLYIIQNGILKNEEIMFLNKILGYIGFGTNCIIKDIKTKEQVPMTQTEIAEALNASRTNMNRLIKQLVEKGVIGRFEQGRENVNAKIHAFYVNPNIIYCGDRDNVNEILKTMFSKQSKYLKGLPTKIV